MRQGVHRCFGAIAPRGGAWIEAASRSWLQLHVRRFPGLGIEASPSFVREPEGNGVAERFIRTSHGEVQVKGVVLG